jgi:hypothetical protein
VGKERVQKGSIAPDGTGSKKVQGFKKVQTRLTALVQKRKAEN